MNVVRILCASSLFVLVGCSTRAKRDGAPATKHEPARSVASPAPPAAATEGVVVGHFETREHRITWLATDAGPRFTIADLQGAVLAANLTDTEVAQRFPELAEFARSALAKLDASVLEDAPLDASDGD